MLKFVHKKSILLLVGFMLLANIDVAIAESSQAGNNGSAQVHVRFKIVIAPSLSMNMATLSTHDLPAKSNSAKNDSTILPVYKAPSSSLGKPTTGNYLLAEWPERENLDSTHKRPRYLILCSP